tara:strand:+ start:401 stop:565 length:165 start_codon:yes stop_codon:yes gene_type:complete
MTFANFRRIGKLQEKFINRAGRLTWPQGKQTLTLSENDSVRNYFVKFLRQEMIT